MFIDRQSDGLQASEKLTLVFSSGELIIYANNDVFVKKKKKGADK